MLKDKNFTHESELKWQKYWAENGIYAFDENGIRAGQKQEARNAKPVYSIDTPPPFTSGELHMGHVLSYSYFDFIARYKRMNGFNVYYPQGWDTQGFPTEVKVEKKFGRLPPAEFRQKCIEWTHEFIARMKAQMSEMGFSPDWKYEYRTMDPEYHRKVQLSLIEMYGKKLVYRAEYPVFWCTSCRSAIAKAELDDVEKDGTIFSIKFSDEHGKDLIIATTRPELMSACVAALYHPEDNRYKHLKGKKVRTSLGKEVPVFEDKDVLKDFGTGLLMVCTFGDKMDVVWMHRHKLPMINVVDKAGKMHNTGMPELEGLKLAEAKKKIAELLEGKGKIVKKENLKQTVKVHDRCGTAVELLPSWQWFADIKNKAKEIKEMAHAIKWVPDFGITYLIDWIEGAEWDWVISRQRVFGTPLPFYYCESCKNTEAAKESELPFYAEKAEARKCSNCQGEMKPEASTCDCWIDSSITPLMIAGWPDDKEKMKHIYPSSLRPQGVEIVRTWAFYTIYRSGVALSGKKPWDTILLNGNVLAPDGKKMSKSLGNIISPGELLRDYPSDAIRQWAALSGALAKDRPFSYEDMKFAKTFITKLWNASKLVEISLNGHVPKHTTPETTNAIDAWIVGSMNSLIKDYSGHFERFEYHHALGKLHNFFWHDFCGNYLEYVKHRIYGNDEKAKHSAQNALYYVLLNTLKLLAPIMPHISEEIFSELFREEFEKEKSIHKSAWPKAGEISEGAMKKMVDFNNAIASIRQHKAKNKLAQNSPLKWCKLTLQEKMDGHLVSEMKAIAKIESLEQEKGEFKVEF